MQLSIIVMNTEVEFVSVGEVFTCNSSLTGRCYEPEICAILLPLRCSFRWYIFLLKSNFSVFGQKPWTIIRRFGRN